VALSPERLGILGGTFNPVHMAHLILAQEAWYRFELKRVVFVPAAQNPLKTEPPEGATPVQRLKMLELATGQDARITIDARDLRHGGPSYMIDTLQRLRSRSPEAELFLLLGADSALTLPQWKDVQAYRELCTVVVCNRPGEQDLAPALPQELLDLGLRMEFMPLPLLEVSASDIRRRVRVGRPIRYLVPDAVAAFIHEHGLYDTD
jgi:nicotinate-nucleotide adenylyltransferase